MRQYYWLRYLDTAAPGAAGSGGDGETPEQKLLKTIQARMKEDLDKRNYADTAAVNAAIAKSLEGLNLDALRTFDQAKIDEKIRNIAADLDKVKGTRSGKDGKPVNELRAILTEKMGDIEQLFNTRGQGQTRELKFEVRAPVVMTTGNVIVEPVDIPDDIIESFSLDAFVPKRYGNQYIYEIADRTVVAALEQYKTWLEEGDEEGAFAMVAEGGLKPLVSYALVRNFVEYKKIAGKYVVTEEVTKFRKAAYAIIQRLIRDKLVRDYSAVITADLQAQAAGYTGTTLDGTIVDPNDYDAIGAVAAQIESLNFLPDVLIVNPQDEWRIRLTKDSQGRYLFPVVTENGQTIILGFRVVKSTYQAVGTFTLGESGLFKIEEEPITVRMGYGITVTGASPVTAVVSDFDNNQFRVIVEMFFRDWIATNNIGSFVTASFATVKAAMAVV